MKLYCVRHGEAHNSDVDAERGLTDQGRQDIERMAQFLAAYPLHVDHIMHSCIHRAEQTANILANALHADQLMESCDLLHPEGDVHEIAEQISTWNEDTMLVGHLPFIAKLVSKLVIQDENYFPIVNFSPGTMVCLDYYEQQRWIISWIIYPDILPK